MSSPEAALIRKAIELDAENKSLPALVKYTEALSAIGGSLLECYRAENFTSSLADSSNSSSATKLLRILNQCVERINALFKSTQITTNRIPTNSRAAASEKFHERRFVIPADDFVSSASSSGASGGSVIAKDDPMTVAVEKNRRLLAAHVERMKHTKMTSAAEATSNMSLQRQLAENIALARKQKQELEEKRDLARQDALEALNKDSHKAGTAVLSEEEKQFVVDVRVFEVDCPELRLFSLELNKFDKQQTNSPQFVTILDHYMDAILSNPDHPFSIEMRRLKRDRQRYLMDLEGENPASILGTTRRVVCEEDVDSLTRCVLLSLQLKPELKPKSDLVKGKIEETYLAILMPSLAEYFRRVRWREIQNLREKIIESSSNSNNSRYSSKFDMILLDLPVIVNAVKTFRSFTDALTPKAMLSILVSTCKAISCQEQQESVEGAAGINSLLRTDDLICALAAILVESKSPDILVWAAIMEEFIDELGVVGEEGFCLTSLQAAIQYLLCAD